MITVLLRVFEATPVKSHTDSVVSNTKKVSVAICNSYLISVCRIYFYMIN